MEKKNPVARLSVTMLLVLALGIAFGGLQFREGLAVPTSWDATFESGLLIGPDGYNAVSPQVTNNATAGVSGSFAHDGHWSEHDYFIGAPPGVKTRAHTIENLFIAGFTPTAFHLELWIFVPSTVDGHNVVLTDWQSFATFAPTTGDVMFTIDSDTAHRISLWNVVLTKSDSTLGRWSFDTWFKLGVTAYLQPAPNKSEVILYLNDLQIADVTEDFTSGGRIANLGYPHFGLYIGPKQGSYAIYDDDISLTPAQAPSTSTTTSLASNTTSSQTTTSSTISLTSSSTSLTSSVSTISSTAGTSTTTAATSTVTSSSSSTASSTSSAVSITSSTTSSPSGTTTVSTSTTLSQTTDSTSSTSRGSNSHLPPVLSPPGDHTTSITTTSTHSQIISTTALTATTRTLTTRTSITGPSTTTKASSTSEKRPADFSYAYPIVDSIWTYIIIFSMFYVGWRVTWRRNPTVNPRRKLT